MTDVWIVLYSPYGDGSFVGGVFSTLEAAKAGVAADAANPGDPPAVLKWQRDDQTTRIETRERWELADTHWTDQTTITRWAVAELEDASAARELLHRTDR